MSWILAYFASAAARPSVVLTVVSFLGLVLLFARRRAGRWLLLAGVGCQMALLVLPVDQWVANPLEQWYPQLREPPAHVDGIVLLGGALRPRIAADRGTPGLNSDAERMTAFAVLARRYPHARLVFTGGSGSFVNNGTTEAAAARTFFREVGLDGRMVYEDRSDNTWENALFTRALMAPKPGETWLLVTSALHMPRSMATFRAAGWEMVPYPTAYRTTHDITWTLALEFADRLALMDAATHEWVGLAAYWLRGRAVLSMAPAMAGTPDAL
jgi:uncharacterized SAM-binding protein YcdF (DUF218 family)